MKERGALFSTQAQPLDWLTFHFGPRGRTRTCTGRALRPAPLQWATRGRWCPLPGSHRHLANLKFAASALG